jgi:MtN3 and saliva related transmembrane protein
MTEVLGWACSAILLATLIKQVYKQWTERNVEGVSKLLFAGQLTASIGFTIYSYLSGNWVFVFTNAMLTLTSLAGIYIYWKYSKEDSGESPQKS